VVINGQGLEIEVFKLAPASGAQVTVGDTATITPRFIFGHSGHYRLDRSRFAQH
jgi:hypothetical protein